MVMRFCSAMRRVWCAPACGGSTVPPRVIFSRPDVGGFFNAESAKESQVDEARLAFVDRLEALERVVQCDEIE
jgi:hypothetical protein